MAAVARAHFGDFGGSGPTRSRGAAALFARGTALFVPARHALDRPAGQGGGVVVERPARPLVHVAEHLIEELGGAEGPVADQGADQMLVAVFARGRVSGLHEAVGEEQQPIAGFDQARPLS